MLGIFVSRDRNDILSGFTPGFQSKIRKPPGQVTRVSRMGYSLKAALKWDDALYVDVQVNLEVFPGNFLILMRVKAIHP